MPSDKKKNSCAAKLRKQHTKIDSRRRARIVRLLTETTLHYTEIAARTGVSKASVGVVSREEGFKSRHCSAGSDEPAGSQRGATSFLCNGCRHYIYEAPCRICEVKAHVARSEMRRLLEWD